MTIAATTSCHTVCLTPHQVLQGRIQVRTRSQFKEALDVEVSSSKSEAGGKHAAAGHGTGHGSSSGSASGGTDSSSSGTGGVSEADLKALFESIDVDGSGELHSYGIILW